MTDLDNPFAVIRRRAPKPTQMEIDVMNMKKLNQANRLYRKCLAGKCPPALDKRVKVFGKRRKKKVLSPEIQDEKLAFVWREIGREHRSKFLEAEVNELDKRIKVAAGKTHRVEHENNFKGISRALKDIDEYEDKTNKAKSEIDHIKSQLERITLRRVELSRETESEDRFQSHLKRAKHQLRIFEGRVENSRQRECLLTAENQKLRELIRNMLCDRAIFNYYWRKIVNNLRDRRQFLLDMIERSNQAFNQGAVLLDNLKQLKSRRFADTEFHISELVNMNRRVDAHQIMRMFLGGKGKRRHMQPLEPREIRRRENFKIEYTQEINMYNQLIEKIKKFTGAPDIEKATDVFLDQESEGFMTYLVSNEVVPRIEYFTSNFIRYTTETLAAEEYNKKKLKYFDQRISDLHRDLHHEISKTMELKDSRDKYEIDIMVLLDATTEIFKILDCDLTRFENLLGDHTKLTVFNIHEFFSAMETRLNGIVAYLYCEERKNADIYADDANLTVSSFKRTQDECIKIKDVITTQQCAECGEAEDVNRFDDRKVYMLDHETIKELMRENLDVVFRYRLHNLSKCNLPRSGVIMGRRFAE